MSKVKPTELGEDTTVQVVDFAAHITRLWAGRWVLAVFALFGCLAGGIYVSFIAKPEFRATAALVLETRSEQVVDLDSVVGGLSKDLPALNTEVEVLKSRKLLGEVVDTLELMQDAEFNPSLSEKSFIARLKAKIKPARGTETVDDITIRNRAVTRLKKRTSVTNVPLSLVFLVDVTSDSPDKSAQIADAIAEAYVSQQISVKYEATEQAVGWLTERVSDLSLALKASENEIEVFRTHSDVLGPQSVDQLDRQLKAIRESISDQSEAYEAAVMQLQQSEKSQAETEKPAASSASLVRTTATGLVTQLRARVARAQNRLTALKAAEVELASELTKQTNEWHQYQELVREAESSRLLYENFLGRLKETSVQQGLQRPDSRILSNAVRPDQPAFPQKSRILGMSAVLGIFAGIGLLILQDMLRKGFRDIATLQSDTGLTVLGQVPELEGVTRSELLSKLASEPASPASEAVRNIRTSLLMARLDDPPKVVMITSSVAEEGKTILSFALAQNLAALGQRVLLIECDFKRPSFERIMRSERKQGLLSVLTTRSELKSTLLSDGETGLDILPCETTSPTSADLFSSKQFEHLIATARETYDHIVLDTPPVLFCPDARVISRVSDAVLFTLRWRHTSRRQFADGLAALQTVHANVAGIVTTRTGEEATNYQAGYGEISDSHALSSVA